MACYYKGYYGDQEKMTFITCMINCTYRIKERDTPSILYLKLFKLMNSYLAFNRIKVVLINFKDTRKKIKIRTTKNTNNN